MTAFFQDWTMVAGDSRTLRFTVTGDDGAAADLTGAQSVRWGCVRRLANGSFVAPPAVEKTLGAGVARAQQVFARAGSPEPAAVG